MEGRIFWDLNKKIVGNDMWYKTTILPKSLVSSDLKVVSRNMDHYFLQFNFSQPKITEHQGFKIHVSGTIDNYKEILDIVYIFCKLNHLTFKYISNRVELNNNFSGKSSLWSAGKFITIYPREDAFKSIISQLYSKFKDHNFQGIYPLTDRRYKDSNIVFYRYGVLNNNENKNIYDLEGNYLYTDYKKSGYVLPDFISEPFPNNKDDSSPHSKFLFKKYYPIQNIYSKASGSVYLVKEKKSNKTYILKNARPNFSDGHISQIERLKKEEKVLIKLKKYDFFPNVVESFSENDNYFLVETIASGNTINKYRAKDMAAYSSGLKITSKSFKILEIIKDMCRKILLLHQNEIFLGDISANNVLINEDKGSINFVDVEQTVINVSTKNVSSFFRTPGFYDKYTELLSPFEQDIQQLGYTIISMFSRANSFLRVDPTGKTTISFFKEFAKVYCIPKTLVEIPLMLIKEHREETLEKILNLELEASFLTPKTINNIFPDEFLEKLMHTYLCDKLDKINTESHEFIEFHNKEDVLFSNKVIKLRLKLFRNDTYKISENNLAQLKKAKNEIINQIHTKLSSEFRSINLSIFLNTLDLIMIGDKQLANNQKDIETIFDYILSNYQVLSGNFIGFKKNLNSHYVIPYLEDGTAGVLTSLLTYKVYFKSTKYDLIMQNLASGLKKMILPKAGGLSNGLAGIILSLLLYKEIFDDDTLDNLIKQMVQKLPLYTLSYNDNLYVVSSNFNYITSNYPEGNLGLIKVLKESKKILNWEKK